MRKLREAMKRSVPDRLRRRIVGKIRHFLDGDGPETRYRPLPFAADATETPRLTLLLPSLSRKMAFGGVNTGLEFFLALTEQLHASLGVETRILTEAPCDLADNLLGKLDNAQRLGVTHACLTDYPDGLPTRAKEVYVAFNWWLSMNVESVLAAQAAHFGGANFPKIHLIQEFEPGFHEFSAAHLLSWQSYNSEWPLWGVFNTRELYDYFSAIGTHCEKSYVFEPRLNASLRPFQSNLDVAEKTRTILVYGRPHTARNCFPLLIAGLRVWSDMQAKSGDSGWRVVSAGDDHEPIDLGGGRALQSLGKLSLEDYGELLRETAVGVSLMASPHPSYPPLEMAHFGARAITNRFAMKDLSSRHDNIVSLADARPEKLGVALDEICRTFEADPSLGLTAQSHMPSFLSETPFDCLDALARDVGGLFAGDAATRSAGAV